MADNEEQYKKDLEASGVDMPELKEASEEKPEGKDEAGGEEKPKVEKKPEGKTDEEPEGKEEKPAKARSIYDEYKAKKDDLRSEKAARESAERERDEFKAKYEALENAGTKEERKEAADDIDAFMASHKEWDKDAISDLVSIARKGNAGQADESVKKDLEDFKSWKSQNQQQIDRQKFQEEFRAAAPTIKELFPTASADEISEVMKELDRLSHTEEYHATKLTLVAFDNKDALSKLVSPKKRGMEAKGNADVITESYDFDPNADYSKLDAAGRKKWEEGYANMTKSEGLVTDANGKKLLI